MSKLRFVAPFALVACSTSLFACGTEPEAAQAEDDIVNIAHSSVKDQEIGNCWIYAATSWAESLHLGYSGEELNLSESWTTYVDFYFGILDGNITDKDGLQTGGWFGEGQDWIARFGYFDEAVFIPGDENNEGARKQASALAALNASIKTGVLSDPAKRRDRLVVREELDKAWGLEPSVISAIDATFGRTLNKDFVTGGAKVPEGITGLRSPATISVGHVAAAGAQPEKEITLADAAGKASSTWNVRSRTGAYAWNEERYPSGASARRTFLQKMQRVLHHRQPVAIVWYVDFAAMKDGVFRAPPTAPGRQGGHITVLEDYQASNVPGYGLLPAGTQVTDPAILEAALAPEAKIDFLRVKNSWGSGYPNLPAEEQQDLRGYHDLYLEYLDASLATCETRDAAGKCQGLPRNGLTGLVFPSTAWEKVGPKPAPQPEPEEPGASCAHGLCANGAKLESSCDPCAATVCAADAYCCSTAWDGICVNEAKTMCNTVCQ